MSTQTQPHSSTGSLPAAPGVDGATPSTCLTEHPLVTFARNVSLNNDPRVRLLDRLVGEGRAIGHQGLRLLSLYRDLFAAHEIAEDILAERKLVADVVAPPKALEIPALHVTLPARPEIRTPAPQQTLTPFPARRASDAQTPTPPTKIVLQMPGRPPRDVAAGRRWDCTCGALNEAHETYCGDCLQPRVTCEERDSITATA